jgi:catalase
MATPNPDARAPRRPWPVCVLLLAAAAWAAPAPAQGDKARAPDAPGLVGRGATITTDTGKPVGDDRNSTTAGPAGPILLQDFYLIEKLARFDRERIPERVVHARGVGVHGEFVSSGDASRWTKAAFLSAPGKKTPVFVRFSTVVLPKGSADTARDVRGFATKFYTEQGNYDLVGNDIPVFFIRDAIRFPDLVHALKPSPVTNVQEPNRYFDFFGAAPESTHMMTFLFSDQGTPASFREMDGFGVDAFKWVNAAGDVHYVKYRWKSAQGVRNFTDDQAKAVGGMEPAYCTKDMYDAVTSGRHPSWELQVQLVPAGELRSKFDFDPLDATKDWPESVVPFRAVGTMTLNRMPDNFFQETEQIAFNTGAYVPGIEPSEDKLLQGRNFSYSDTQRHRLGPNYQQLPINQPPPTVRNVNQEGLSNHAHTRGDVNYEPSVRAPHGPAADPQSKAPATPLHGATTQEPIEDPQDFRQAGERIRAMAPEDRDHMLHNFSVEFKKVRDRAVLERFVSNLYRADADFGRRLAEAAGVGLERVKELASDD